MHVCYMLRGAALQLQPQLRLTFFFSSSSGSMPSSASRPVIVFLMRSCTGVSLLSSPLARHLSPAAPRRWLPQKGGRRCSLPAAPHSTRRLLRPRSACCDAASLHRATGEWKQQVPGAAVLLANRRACMAVRA